MGLKEGTCRICKFEGFLDKHGYCEEHQYKEDFLDSINFGYLPTRNETIINQVRYTLDNIMTAIDEELGEKFAIKHLQFTASIVLAQEIHWAAKKLDPLLKSTITIPEEK